MKDTEDNIDLLYKPNIYLISLRDFNVTCNIVNSTKFGGQHVKILNLVTNNVPIDSDLLGFEYIHNKCIHLGERNIGLIEIRIVDAKGVLS